MLLQPHYQILNPVCCCRNTVGYSRKSRQKHCGKLQFEMGVKSVEQTPVQYDACVMSNSKPVTQRKSMRD